MANVIAILISITGNMNATSPSLMLEDSGDLLLEDSTNLLLDK